MCDMHRASGSSRSPAFAAPSAVLGKRWGYANVSGRTLAHFNGAAATRRPRASGARMMAGVP
eukprot:IDg11642t1